MMQSQLMASPQANMAQAGAQQMAPQIVSGAGMEQVMHIPRIAIQAFCDTPGVASTIERAGADRRMNKAHVSVSMGGISAAIDTYAAAPTPNLIVLETAVNAANLLADLERLAECCDAGTKVVVIGQFNDVALYRELIARGISDYLVVPFDIFQFISSVDRIFADTNAEPIGRLTAFIGAKGGCGASTIAHNVAYMAASQLELSSAIVDLDLPYGVGGLNFNKESAQTVLDAVASSDRIDGMLLDRLMTKCTDRLNLVAAPVQLSRAYDFEENDFDDFVDVMRRAISCAVLDVPHLWCAWTRRVLALADDIVLICEPDLPNLRNARNMIESLAAMRPNDTPVNLVLNKVGAPKRPELTPDEFIKTLGLSSAVEIPYDAATFGNAVNNGQMIAEFDKKNALVPHFMQLAQKVNGRENYSIKVKADKGGAAKGGGSSLIGRLLKRGK